MDIEMLYQAIFHRKSVRKYDPLPLTESSMVALEHYLEHLHLLCPEIKTEIRILPDGALKSNAPQSMAIYSEKKAGYRMNAGFLMEQIDLYLSTNNIGACWLGMAKPTEQDVPIGMEYVVSMCFGTPAEGMHRKDVGEFKRNTLNAVSGVTDLYNVLEAVRLSPSAMNSQPWFFGGSAEKIIVSRKKSLMLGKLNQIDIGICLCCLWLSLKHQGKHAEFDFVPAPVLPKHVFMANVSVID